MKIEVKNNQNIWFTSDTHYGHKNLCLGTSEWEDKSRCRKFDTIYHMNDVIVNSINKNVAQDDILVHLGDWSFGGFVNIIEFRHRIVCKNVYLFLGNHDHHIKKNRDGVKDLFTYISKYDVLDIRIIDGEVVNKYKLVAMHYPIHEWEGIEKGYVHIHGHTHLPADKKVSKTARAMDIGMDGNDYKPYTLHEILRLTDKPDFSKLILPETHHL